MKMEANFSMRIVLTLFSILVFSGKNFGQHSVRDSVGNSDNSIFQYSDPNQSLKIKTGGRIYVDYVHRKLSPEIYHNLENPPVQNGMSVNSAEIQIDGKLYEHLEFNFKTDFSGNKVAVKRAYIGYTNIPVIGTLRVGYQYEPFRFSSLSSSKYATFIEKTNNHHFSKKSNMGLVAFNNFFSDRLMVQAGLFQNGNNSNEKPSTQDGFAFVSRVATLPYIDKNRERLLHLGLGFSHRKPKSKIYELWIPFDSYFSTTNMITEPVLVNRINLFNIETVYIHRSFSFQSEYIRGNLQGISSDFKIENFYTIFSWFLTGEQKNYSGGYGGFSKIQPQQNFNLSNNGWGAWELAAGFSRTQLPEKIYRSGKSSDFLLGINWYLNSYSRIMFNFSHSEYDEKQRINTFQTRFQVNF